MRLSLSSYGLLALVLTLGACGGSGVPDGYVGSAHFDISWPTRTRAMDAPASALSFRFVMSHAGQDGADVIVVGNRPTGTGSSNQTYTLPKIIANSGGSFTVTFYAGAGQTGAVVGTATDTATLTGNQLNIGTINLSGTVKTVTVANSTLTIGDPASQLVFTAKDEDSNLMAVSPGSATWRLTDGNAFVSLTTDGLATPVSAGTAHVIAKVDGVDSNSGSVSVQQEVSQIAFELIKQDTAIEYAEQIFGNKIILDRAQILDYPSQTLTSYQGGKASPNLLNFLADFRSMPADQMHAAVRTGGPSGSVIDLHPPGLTNSKTYDLDNGTQVGTVFSATTPYTHAALWTGTASSFTDLAPAGTDNSAAQSTFNGITGGYANYVSNHQGRAVIWSGTSPKDVHPVGWNNSAISQVGLQYVTGGVANDQADHFVGVWTTGGSGFKVLEPGAQDLVINAVGRDGVTAEYAVGAREHLAEGVAYAVIWNLKTGKSINLDELIPSGSKKGSYAMGLGVAPDGQSIRVTGRIHKNLRDFAAMWTIPDSVLETIRN